MRISGLSHANRNTVVARSSIHAATSNTNGLLISVPWLLSQSCLRLFWVFESSFLLLSSFAIHVRNLFEARVIITAYNQHVRLLSPGLGWLAPTKSTRAFGSRHCYGIITLILLRRMSRKNSLPSPRGKPGRGDLHPTLPPY